MKSNKLYFYRKTMRLTEEEQEKRGCKYFNSSAGVAGFTRPQARLHLFLYGTHEELAVFLKERKICVRAEEDMATFRGGVE